MKSNINMVTQRFIVEITSKEKVDKNDLQELLIRTIPNWECITVSKAKYQ